MPSTSLLEIPPEEQDQMQVVLRRMRYGYLLAFHILLLCAAGRTPTEIAAFLFYSRSSVYRTVWAYHTGSLGIRVDQFVERQHHHGRAWATINRKNAPTSGSAIGWGSRVGTRI